MEELMSLRIGGKGTQSLFVKAPWEEDELECKVCLRNAAECSTRLKELVVENGTDSAFCNHVSDNMKEFFGDADSIKRLSYQEYEGPKNMDAIKTFFRHAYCFVSDSDDDTTVRKERYLIWVYGYQLDLKEIKKSILKLKNVQSIFTLQGTSELSIPNDQIRISVWRIREEHGQ